MIHERTFLGRALALSLILHAAAIAGLWRFSWSPPRIAPPAQPEIKVSFRTPPVMPALSTKPDTLASPPALPRLLLPQASLQNPKPAARAVPQPSSPAWIEGAAALRAAEQLERELLYPREAIERGLQGEALVLLFLDAAGNAMAARLESSSGHALLDDAAVRAARTLRALPDNAPREVLLPVRFRLR
jgi:periplasmic protein TonB